MGKRKATAAKEDKGPKWHTRESVANTVRQINESLAQIQAATELMQREPELQTVLVQYDASRKAALTRLASWSYALATAVNQAKDNLLLHKAIASPNGSDTN